jgi:hypothetical protein
MMFEDKVQGIRERCTVQGTRCKEKQKKEIMALTAIGCGFPCTVHLEPCTGMHLPVTHLPTSDTQTSL